MKRIQRRIRTWCVVVLCVSVVGVLLAMIGFSNTVHRLAEATVAKTPDAILANAEVGGVDTIRMPVMYYDQREDVCANTYSLEERGALEMRQFEWSSCGYDNSQIERGLVNFELNDDKMPVAVKGQLLSNRGIDMTRWYNAVDGQSDGYAGMLELQNDSSGQDFRYYEEEFYPLDGVDFSAADKVNTDKHNRLFTMSFAIPFTVLGSGEEQFSIIADDDTFVFIEDKLAIDMGGVHDATTGRFVIHENGEVYAGVEEEALAYTGINVTIGSGAMVRIFHADRDSKGSVFGIDLENIDLNVIDTELANEDGGVQIAYDPSNPSYIPPLGDSMIFRPDTTKGLIVLATVEGVAIFASALMVMFATRYLVKSKTQ